MKGQQHFTIGIVGPCASGKSTLITALQERGYHTRHIAQEHSFVPDMWKRLSDPDVLIYLDASYPATCRRRELDWTESDLVEQKRRLEHARQYADLYIDTSNLSARQVLLQVLKFLEAHPGVAP